MAHAAIGHLEALKKKELVLAAMMMTEEEFQKLAANRSVLIVEPAASGKNHPNFDAPIPACQLIVDLNDSTDNTSDKAPIDMIKYEGGV